MLPSGKKKQTTKSFKIVTFLQNDVILHPQTVNSHVTKIQSKEEAEPSVTTKEVAGSRNINVNSSIYLIYKDG